MKILRNKEYLDMKETIKAVENEKNKMYLKNIDEIQHYEKIINDIYCDLIQLRNCIKTNTAKSKLIVKVQDIIIKIGGKI